jgi:hypothetical protein
MAVDPGTIRPAANVSAAIRGTSPLFCTCFVDKIVSKRIDAYQSP